MSLPALGIDIAKDSYCVALRHEDKLHQGEFENTPAGFKRLTSWLHKRGVRRVHACLEATGRYSDELAHYLHEQGQEVSVVNPLRIKAYAQSRLARNKTDEVDAELIADFCASQHPPAWTPPAPEVRELQELAHQYDVLQVQRTQLTNRLGAGLKSAAVKQQLQDQLDLVDQQIAELKRLIDDHIERHPDLKRQHDLVDSITGFGSLTAAKIIAADPQRFEDSRAFAAYAGLTPMHQVSGSSVRRKSRLSKIGDVDLRRALYFPALSAMRFNKLIRNFCERLAQKGKHKMTIIAAAMHKLLVLAYGVLKSGKPFDPLYVPKSRIAP